jgi:hypothetical protein
VKDVRPQIPTRIGGVLVQVLVDRLRNAGTRCGRERGAQRAQERGPRHQDQAIKISDPSGAFDIGGDAARESLRRETARRALTAHGVQRAVATSVSGHRPRLRASRPIGIEIPVVQVRVRIQKLAGVDQRATKAEGIEEAGFALIGDDDTYAHDSSVQDAASGGAQHFSQPSSGQMIPG